MTRYIEVFGSADRVLFSREQDGAMEVFNDYNGDLINLYRCVRERTFALLRELNFLPLQSRDEFNLLRRRNSTTVFFTMTSKSQSTCFPRPTMKKSV